MNDLRDLKALQLDALKEVANIGAGHAATALSQMTNSKIMISVPRITVTPLEAVPAQMKNPDNIVAAVLMQMVGDLTGRTLMMIPESDARSLCDRLLSRAPGTTQVF